MSFMFTVHSPKESGIEDKVVGVNDLLNTYYKEYCPDDINMIRYIESLHISMEDFYINEDYKALIKMKEYLESRMIAESLRELLG